MRRPKGGLQPLNGCTITGRWRHVLTLGWRGRRLAKAAKAGTKGRGAGGTGVGLCRLTKARAKGWSGRRAGCLAKGCERATMCVHVCVCACVLACAYAFVHVCICACVSNVHA